MRPIVNMPEENRATDIGNIHKKFGKDRACGAGDILADRQTHRQTYCSAELAPNYSRTTTELAELIWLPPHLVSSCWNGIVRPSAPYKRSPELRSILIRTGQPSDTRRTYQTEYGWISDVEQSNRTPIPSHRIRT